MPKPKLLSSCRSESCFSDQMVKTMLCHLMTRSEKTKIMARSKALILLQNPEHHDIIKWLEKAHQCFVKNKCSAGPSLSKRTPNRVLRECIFVVFVLLLRYQWLSNPMESMKNSMNVLREGFVVFLMEIKAPWFCIILWNPFCVRKCLGKAMFCQ